MQDVVGLVLLLTALGAVLRAVVLTGGTHRNFLRNEGVAGMALREARPERFAHWPQLVSEGQVLLSHGVSFPVFGMYFRTSHSQSVQ